MAPMTKIDPKYDALFKSRVASQGDPQLIALQFIIHLQVQIAKKIELTKFLNIHKIIISVLMGLKLWDRPHSTHMF